jgi:hypothetical protein
VKGKVGALEMYAHELEEKERPEQLLRPRLLTELETIPQRLKPLLYLWTYGTDKSVPFQSCGFFNNKGRSSCSGLCS